MALSGLVPVLKSYICPTTKNQIRPEVVVPGKGPHFLKDLENFAVSKKDPGHSYETFGFMGPTRNVKKTEATVQSYVHAYRSFDLQGVKPGPARIWLMVDGDDAAKGGINDYPDPLDNHGAAGANANFCDGHAEWIPVRNYLHTYELSQDEGRVRPPELTINPGTPRCD